jgi:ribonuclease P protein component
MATTYTFGKEERLKSSLAIQDLLKNGHSLSLFPLKIYWNFPEGEPSKQPVRTAVLVPKRKFKRAVDRNMMKRRIREAFRLNKNLLYEPVRQVNLNINMVILFLADEFISFEKLDACIRELLGRMADEVL